MIKQSAYLNVNIEPFYIIFKIVITYYRGQCGGGLSFNPLGGTGGQLWFLDTCWYEPAAAILGIHRLVVASARPQGKVQYFSIPCLSPSSFRAAGL